MRVRLTGHKRSYRLKHWPDKERIYIDVLDGFDYVGPNHKVYMSAIRVKNRQGTLTLDYFKSLGFRNY